uniref:Tropomodulin n=1 Tax=Alexandrium catenella TaxID=2925 RepID=A0A7S1MLW5_ALECA|mmetsp:Transcript_29623/g.80039  ORF Transcript_29623/g.80039 Transcript_29623/m.80039 type:complete len:853 (+) Transcript_29623:73-2631(+)
MAWDDGHRRHSAPFYEVVPRLEKPGRRSIPVEVEVLKPSPQEVPAAPAPKRPACEVLDRACEAAAFAAAIWQLPLAGEHLAGGQPVAWQGAPREPAPARPVRPRARTLSPVKPATSSTSSSVLPAALAAAERQKQAAVQLAAAMAPGTYLPRTGSSVGFSAAPAPATARIPPPRLQCWDDVTGPPPQRTPSTAVSYQPPIVLPSPRSGVMTYQPPIRTSRTSRVSGCSATSAAAVPSAASSASSTTDAPQEAAPRLHHASTVSLSLDVAKNTEGGQWTSGASGCSRGRSPQASRSNYIAESNAGFRQSSPNLSTPQPPRRQVRPVAVTRGSHSKLPSASTAPASAREVPARAQHEDLRPEAAGPAEVVYDGSKVRAPVRSSHLPTESWDGHTETASDAVRTRVPARASRVSTDSADGHADKVSDAVKARLSTRASRLSTDSADGQVEVIPDAVKARLSARASRLSTDSADSPVEAVPDATKARLSARASRLSTDSADGHVEVLAEAVKSRAPARPSHWSTDSADDHPEVFFDAGKTRVPASASRPSTDSTTAGVNSSAFCSSGRASVCSSQALSGTPCFGPGAPVARGSVADSGSRRASAAASDDAASGIGSWALSTIDEELAGQICTVRDIAQLERLDLPFPRVLTGPNPAYLGTWMIWMVQRVALNESTLTVLDFTSYQMPSAAKEPRIAQKLVDSLAGNTHLRELFLTDSNLRGGAQAKVLAASLVKNSTLRALNIALNFLEPADLKDIFAALAENMALEDLKCSNQFCDQAGWDAYQALAAALKQNRTLRKLGMELNDAHWRDQINRALIRNTEARRKKRWQATQGLRHEAILGEELVPGRLVAGGGG